MQSSARAFTTAHAGVSGILKREEAQAKQADETLQEAFSDLNALMVRQGVCFEKAMRTMCGKWS